jgi:hypothetical protein
MKKELKLDDYISIAKSDINTYIIVAMIIFGVLLFIGYKVDFYYILFFDLIMIFRILERISTYNNLKMIKKYLIDKDLVNKIEKIDFWNEKNYFLTSNYLIIVQHKSVYAIKYSDISKIYVETILDINRPGSYEEYLHIFSSNNEFKILTFSTKLVGEELMNIKDYLLNKNDKIIVEENKKG